MRGVTMSDYDLIIIGGGAAAFAAAHTAATLQKRILIIHDSSDLPLGGTCVNVGCIPTKILLHQGDVYHSSTSSGFSSLMLTGTIDFIQALRETRALIETLRKKKYQTVLERNAQVDFIEGRAALQDPHTVRVAQRTFSADFILLATGASPFIPPIPGLDATPYHTHRTILQLERTPRSVLILGGGPQAMEFAQLFHRFGISVTVLQRSERILQNFDPLLGSELRTYLEEEGISIHTGVHVESVQKTSVGVSVTALLHGTRREFTRELLFLATGIKPNTDALHCEDVGVTRDARGFIQVNEYLQTSQETIYAAGDVTGLRPLETIAAKQGSVAVRNMFTHARETIDYTLVPQAVFTSPQVAAVGITEEEYMSAHGTCLCSTIRLDHVEKAVASKNTRGVIKMVLDPATKRILGVHIVSPFAAEVITLATYAIRNKMTIYDVRDTVHVFPTWSEMIKKVAQSFEYDLDDLACCVE